MVGMTILYVVVFSIWKDEDGNDMCSMEECFSKGVAWGPILLFMVTIPLAAAKDRKKLVFRLLSVACTPISSRRVVVSVV